MPRISDERLRALVEAEVHGVAARYPVMCWDLDSTVCNTLHRQEMVPAIKAGGEGAPTWDDYSMRCADDEPVHGSVALMRELSRYNHVAVSGRSARAKDLTWDWAAKHHVPFAGIILRPDGDHTKNWEWKSRVLGVLKELGFDVRMFFEDWDEAAEKIHEVTSIPVLGVNPFYPESAVLTAGGL